MKQDPGSKSASHSDSNTQSSPRSGSVVKFAADRANDLADVLHERAKDQIDRAQRSVTHINIESAWLLAQPLLLSTGRFIRQHPLRSGLILALMTGAALLTRTPATQAR